MRRGDWKRQNRATSRRWRSALSLAAEREASRHLARALGWPFVEFCDYQISCGILRRMATELSCRLRAVPMIFNARRAVLVVDDPYNAFYILANRELLGPPYDLPLEFALTTRTGLDDCLLRRLTLARS